MAVGVLVFVAAASIFSLYTSAQATLAYQQALKETKQELTNTQIQLNTTQTNSKARFIEAYIGQHYFCNEQAHDYTSYDAHFSVQTERGLETVYECVTADGRVDSYRAVSSPDGQFYIYGLGSTDLTTESPPQPAGPKLSQ